MWESSVFNCLGFIHVGNRAAFFLILICQVYCWAFKSLPRAMRGKTHLATGTCSNPFSFFFFSPSRLQNTSWQLCPWQVQSLEEWWGVLLVSLQASKWQELQLHLVVGFWVSQVENWYKEENRNRSSRSLAAVQSFLAKVPKNPAEV